MLDFFFPYSFCSFANKKRRGISLCTKGVCFAVLLVKTPIISNDVQVLHLVVGCNEMVELSQTTCGCRRPWFIGNVINPQQMPLSSGWSAIATVCILVFEVIVQLVPPFVGCFSSFICFFSFSHVFKRLRKQKYFFSILSWWRAHLCFGQFDSSLR